MIGKRILWLAVVAGALLLVSACGCDDEDEYTRFDCNEGCATSGDCVPGLYCYWTDHVCRNEDCPDEEDCECPAACSEPCEEAGDCVAGLDCTGGVCANSECPEAEDCECPIPAVCSEPCEDAGGCTAGLVCTDGVCVNSECPEAEDCECPPPGICDEPCEVAGDCEAGLDCLEGFCTNPECPGAVSCDCPPLRGPGPIDELYVYLGIPSVAWDQLDSYTLTDQPGDFVHYDPNYTVTNPDPNTDILLFGGAQITVTEEVANHWFGPGGPFAGDNTICHGSGLAATDSLVLFWTKFDGLVPAGGAGGPTYLIGMHFNVGGELHVSDEYPDNVHNNTNVWYQLHVCPVYGRYTLATRWFEEQQVDMPSDFCAMVLSDTVTVAIPRGELPGEFTYGPVAQATDGTYDPTAFCSDRGWADSTGPTAELNPMALYITRTIDMVPEESVEVPAQIVEYFVDWNAAFASGDGDFLYSSLHRASIERYGGLQCQDYVTSVVPSATSFYPDTATEVGLWVYETDAISTVVGNIWDVYGEFTTPAGTTWQSSHVALEGDSVSWMTDCGVPFEFEAGVELDDGYTVCGASCRKREKIVEGQKIRVWCMNDSACTALGCECHLFSRDRDDAQDDPDSWEYVAGPAEKVLKDNDLAYKCFCVE